MPTPAEIIAARYQTDENVVDIEELDYSSIQQQPKNTSISNESAFPTLGGGKNPSTTNTTSSTWGPKMKSPPVANHPKVSTPKLPSVKTNGSNGNHYKSKVSTVQEAFSLDFDDQLNVAKPEFSKILTSIQNETKTKIEFSSSQHTRKRMFLISGRPEEVKLAKKLIIKKLTKPIQLQFTIPSKLRSRVIGQGGKTLKPIIQANDVRIEIGDQVEQAYNDSDDVNDDKDDDDIFNKVVQITIDGDIEGSKSAKNQILQIVKQETKNLSTKIQVDEKIKPFIGKYLEKIVENNPELTFSIPDYQSNKSNIIIIGDRDLILEVKPEIKQILNNISNKIIIEEVSIPKPKHQFLPIDEVLQSYNVLIQLPNDSNSNIVKFIGEGKDIKRAQEFAKITTLQFKVEVLDMSKAHKGDLKHVKAVAALLTKLGIFDQIGKSNDVIINTPTQLNEVTTIPIEIISKNNGSEENIKMAKKSIVANVNRITPNQTKTIEDIDSFLLNKIDETISEIAAKEGVDYVVIDNVITLFEKSNTNQEAEDFEEFTTSSSDSFDLINKALDKLRDLSQNIINSVLQISSKQQDQIIKHSLKSIISSLEPNSVTIKLHYPSSDELTIHGLKPSVAIVKKSVETDIAEAEEYPDGFTTTLVVPNQVVPRLIGKNGSNLNQLREEFNVKIEVPEEEKRDTNDKIEVTIVGLKRNVEQSKSKISSLSKKWADETLSRLKIESQYHRRIIGPRGVYINRLQDKYNVKIRFPSINGDDFSENGYSDSPKSPNEITIKGPSKGVAKAEEEMKELYQFEKENGFKQTIQIPIKAIARVIGKSGETINDIADGTGIEYRFNRENDEQSKGYSEVELVGSKSALKEAISKINQIIEDVENFTTRSIEVDANYHRELIGPGGSIMKQIISKAGGDDVPRHKYQRLLNIPNQGSGSNEITSQGDKAIVDKIIEQIEQIINEKKSMIEHELDLPKEKHRLIIGPNGSIRHSLQDEFNVVVDIPRANDDSSTIKLKGLPEKIDLVVEKIQELTKDDWKKTIEVPFKYHGLISERGGVFKKFKNDYGVEITHGNLTRQANKLSNSSIVNPPQSAYPENDEEIKFTIISDVNEDEGDEQFIPWRLKGEDDEKINKVYKIIEDKLNLIKDSNSQGWFYSNQPSNFSKIIGPQGSRINKLRLKTNTFITVPRSNDKTNENFIYLVGNEDNLKLAEKEIKNLL